MKKRIVFGWLFFLLIMATGATAPAQSAQDAASAFIREYKIGPRDLLEIRVIDLPELTKFEVRVSEDGTITLPLLGSIQVGGNTKDAVERKLADLLGLKVMKNPQVSVFIKEYQSNRVAVIGAVNKPGMIELVGAMNLLQVISQAGGLDEKAANEIFVLREGKDGTTASIRIDLEDLMINGNAKLNIPLKPNDTINIPIDKIISIYVFGAVRNPGALQVKQSKKTNILQAIAQAGGLTESGKMSGITITRTGKDGKEEKIIVNLNDVINGKKPNIVLKEGDVVYVKESIF